ncbi:MAG: hypothetical protein ACUVS4_08455 [Chloroflexaceae bacterium]
MSSNLPHLSQPQATVLAWWSFGIAVTRSCGRLAVTTFIAWYGLRVWCAQGFKCTRRGGWQWQMTQMTDPDRAARLWLALALAMFWMVTIGTDLEASPPAPCLERPDLRPLLGGVRRGRIRHMRLLRLGWLWLLVPLIQQAPLPVPQQLVPEP